MSSAPQGTSSPAHDPFEGLVAVIQLFPSKLGVDTVLSLMDVCRQLIRHRVRTKTLFPSPALGRKTIASESKIWLKVRPEHDRLIDSALLAPPAISRLDGDSVGKLRSTNCQLNPQWIHVMPLFVRVSRTFRAPFGHAATRVPLTSILFIANEVAWKIICIRLLNFPGHRPCEKIKTCHVLPVS
ncbi:unnamed protein product [Nesidiocoris tenuis]|uniref:Uncharacterized protein n=1 Tax=Nesidiocoris tenuis TaxID=355587 RepID=A0A6H5FX97_9HEMI|nr:unnamed protein product [Nesidiocoris tenuis]